MTGLLRNSYYGALGSAKVLVAFFVVAGFALVFTCHPLLLSLFGVVTATVFSANAVSGIRKEASTKWSKYELTTPVNRKDIVKSRYITHALWIMVGILISAAFIGLAVMVQGNRFFANPVRDPMAYLCENVGIALFTGVIYYPLTYILGTDRGEVTIILSFLGALGFTFGTIWAINTGFGFRELSDAEYYLSMAIFMVVAIASFVSSYFLSVFVYRRKEF